MFARSPANWASPTSLRERRRAGERVRINAQLMDAIAGATLWAERYDRDLRDIFAVQNEVVATLSKPWWGDWPWRACLRVRGH